MGALQNRYELRERLETLEAGFWHRGEDVRSRRAVRIALLPPDAPGARVDAFDRVARLSTKIRHPGVERVVASGRDDEGRAFIVFEHLQGEPLAARLLTDPPVKLHDFLRSMTSVLNGLDIAHKAGLVHGAVEPSRLLVDEKLRAQLVGFALHGATGSSLPAGLDAWLAPEVLAGDAPTAASDVYGVGAILYRALVGEPPKPGGARLRERRRGLPASLAETIEKAIASAPSDRPQSAGDLRKELTAAMVGASGLRTLVVPRTAEADDATDITESLSLADLEIPSDRELVAWSKKAKGAPKPGARARSGEANRRKARPTSSRATPWKRNEPPPLPLPANSTSNERALPPLPPARTRPANAKPNASGAGGAPKKSPVLAKIEVKTVLAQVPRRTATPRFRVEELETLHDFDEVDELDTIREPAASIAQAIAEAEGPIAASAEADAPAAAPAEPEAASAAPPGAGRVDEARPLEGTDDDDEPELEASAASAADDDDDDDLDEPERPRATAEPPKPTPWPYPTGGPPGLFVPPPPPKASSVGAPPALAIGLLALGIVLAAAGSLRLATRTDGPASALVEAPTSAQAELVRPRRRASPPRAPAPVTIETPVTVAPAPALPPPAAVEPEPPAAPVEPEPRPVVTAPERPRRAVTAPARAATPRRRARTAAPAHSAPSMAAGRTLVRDPGF